MKTNGYSDECDCGWQLPAGWELADDGWISIMCPQCGEELLCELETGGPVVMH